LYATQVCAVMQDQYNKKHYFRNSTKNSKSSTLATKSKCKATSTKSSKNAKPN
jgi:hypothetical protein